MRVAFFPHVPHYTIGLTSALKTKGVDVTIVSSLDGGAEPPRPSLSLLTRLPKIPEKSKSLLIKANSLREFDVVHTQGALNSLPALISWRRDRVPFVLTEHGFPQPEVEPIGVNLALEVMEFGSLRYFATQASGFATISHFARSAIRHRNGVDSQVIYHGVDGAIFNQRVNGSGVRAKLALGEDEPLILWATRFTPIKDPLTFVMAAQRVAAAFPRARFLMIGEGPLRSSAEHAAGKLLGDGRMTFKRRVRFEDMAAHYAACDAFVYTGFREGFGLAVAEAMACSKPVVVCKAGSVPEIVGQDGLYFAAGDEKSLAGSLEGLLSDADHAMAMATRGGERVRKTFTWENAAESYISLYERSIGREKR